MSQYSPSKDIQSKSKSEYSDACQNEAELNQILHRPQRQKMRVKNRSINNDNSFMKVNSKDKINVKYLEELNDKKIHSSSEYRSFHEEKTSNKNEANANELDKNLNIDENMKQFEISSINSNSNKNFMEENTDTELNKIFGITNSDKNSQKARRSKEIKNYSLYNNIKEENSFHNFKTMNITSDIKFNKLNNPNVLNSLLYNNNYNQNLKNNLTTTQNQNQNKVNPLNNQKIIKPIIDTIKFEGFEKDDLDKNYFDNKLTNIITKSKNIKSDKNKHIKTLYELQNFEADNSAITSININEEGNFIGIGFKSGKIKIYEIMNYLYQKYKLNYMIKNLHEYLNFINETPYKTLSGHPNEILDLIWLQSNNNNIFMLSASLDLVILWNLSRANNFITRKYFHRQIILYISVNQVHKNIFGTACNDNIIRLWPISRTLLGLPKIEKYAGENAPKQFYVQENITTFNFFRDGDRAAVGTFKGKVYVYDIFPKIKFLYKFECKNTFGKSIININFYSKSICAISSLDSRIRLVNIENGHIIQKYKGHQNEKYKIKNYNYEYFKIASSNNIINVAQIVSEKYYVNYFKKILSITNKIILDSIIIIGNDKGEIKILINIK